MEKNKPKLFDPAVKASSKRLEGGVKPMDVQLENQLVEWIYGRRSNGMRVSRKLIMVKAKSLYDESSDADENEKFVASTGWLNNFMRRNGQQDPARLTDKIISYILHVRRLSSRFNYHASCIIAMDETPVSNTTVDVRGEKSVCLKTTGNEKCMASVCLAAKDKLKCCQTKQISVILLSQVPTRKMLRRISTK